MSSCPKRSASITEPPGRKPGYSESWRARSRNAAPPTADRVDHRRVAGTPRRTARGSAAARQHRDGIRQAAANRARWTAGAGGPPESIVAAPVEAARRAALRAAVRSMPVETAEYIAGRIRIAGGNSVLVFTRQAVDAIYERSHGIPRLISVICDNALISAFAADRRPVSRDIVEEVCRDFDLLPKGRRRSSRSHRGSRGLQLISRSRKARPRLRHPNRPRCRSRRRSSVAEAFSNILQSVGGSLCCD